MKNVALSLFPVVIFWIFEDQFGTFWGIIAAIVWSIGELGYEKKSQGRFSKLTLFSSISCIIFGILGLALDNSHLFRVQPALLEVVFAGVFVWMMRGENPQLFQMMAEKNQKFQSTPEMILRLRPMMYRMVGMMLIHVGVLAWVGLNGTTSEWVFVKGPGFVILLGLWFGIEFLVIKWRASQGPRS